MPIKSRRHQTVVFRWVLAGVLLTSVVPVVRGVDRPSTPVISFLGVDSEKEAATADERLFTQLKNRVKGGAFEEHASLKTYEDTLTELVDSRQAGRKPLIARTTPFVLVAAELQGAELHVLGTYQRSSRPGDEPGATTYVPYLIVNRQRVAEVLKDGGFNHETPTESDVVRFASQIGPRFVYKEKLSTSGLFMPAMFFRRHPEITDVNTLLIRPGESVTKLVARGDADIAGGWDETKAAATAERINGQPVLEQVHFVPLAGRIPNDLLVCTSSVPAEIRRDIMAALEEQVTIDRGSFGTWKTVKESDEVDVALQELRDLSTAQPYVNVIEVARATTLPTGYKPVTDEYIDATRRAIQRAGPGWAWFNRERHRTADYKWELSLSEDNSLHIVSSALGRSQELEIPVSDLKDLSRRIRAVMDSELSLIRYVWPFAPQGTVVIRDFEYPPAPGEPVTAQQIAWNNRGTHLYKEVTAFPLYTLDVTDERITFRWGPSETQPPNNGANVFDVTGQSPVRVLVPRQHLPAPWIRQLTSVFVLLLVVTTGTAAVEAWRRKAFRPPPEESKETIAAAAMFDRVWAESGGKARASWSRQTEKGLRHAELAWIDRRRIEEIIAEKKLESLLVVDTYESGNSAEASLGWKVFKIGRFMRRSRQTKLDPKAVGDEERLVNAIDVLVAKQFASILGACPEVQVFVPPVGDLLKHLAGLVAAWRRDLATDPTAITPVAAALWQQYVVLGHEALVGRLVLIRLRWRIDADTAEKTLCVSHEWVVGGDPSDVPNGMSVRWQTELSGGSIKENRLASADDLDAWLLAELDDIDSSQPRALIVRARALALVRARA